MTVPRSVRSSYDATVTRERTKCGMLNGIAASYMWFMYPIPSAMFMMFTMFTVV